MRHRLYRDRYQQLLAKLAVNTHFLLPDTAIALQLVTNNARSE